MRENHVRVEEKEPVPVDHDISLRISSNSSSVSSPGHLPKMALTPDRGPCGFEAFDVELGLKWFGLLGLELELRSASRGRCDRLRPREYLSGGAKHCDTLRRRRARPTSSVKSVLINFIGPASQCRTVREVQGHSFARNA